MKKMLLTFATVFAFGILAQAESDTCHIVTAGEDQKLECAQEKLERKIARLNKLLNSIERKLEEERLEQINEGDSFQAQSLEILQLAVQKVQSELAEAQEKLDKLVKKHHELDEQTDTKEGLSQLKAKAQRLKNRIEKGLKKAFGRQ